MYKDREEGVKEWHETLIQLAAQQAGQIHLLILAPLFTLAFLSLLVHTASSAIDPALEKQKVTEQLKRRLSELQQDPLPPPPSEGASAAPAALPPSARGSAGGDNTNAQTETFFLVDSWQVKEGWTGQHFIRWSEPKGEAVHASTRLAALSSPKALFSLTSSPPQGRPFLRFSCRQAASDDPSDTVGTQTTGITGRLLSNERLPMPLAESFAERIMRLVIAFEHGESTTDEAFGTVAGDFDGQGLSFGLLQWNLGRCTLQPLLRAFQRTDPARFARSLEGGTEVIETLMAAPCEEAPRLARRLLLDEEGRVPDPWVERFRSLGRERVFQAIQLSSLRPSIREASRLAQALGLHSERAVALCFDIVIQNGGIPRSVRAQYLHDVRKATRELGRAPTEVERMLILANRQAEAAKPQWIKTVRTRKVTIACGEGRVNGLHYRLDALGITLRPYQQKG
ncbi:MAG TPA: hypothetical protein VNN62_24020 [Methylomirabilota bacterium]|jgi:hypothetical protein|nr:hypothetical protein [Methylomirabilota bacterium]